MNTHIIKVLDRDTEIMCMAIRMEPLSNDETQLAFRFGWGIEPEKDYLFLASMTPNVRMEYDPYHWDNGRTLHIAHRYLLDLFHTEGWETILKVHAVDVRELEHEKPGGI